MKILFKGANFLLTVAACYIILFILQSEKTLLALQKSGTILLSLLPLFALIIVLTTLINYFLKPKQIMKNFGKDSGTKGVFYALFGGIISHQSVLP